MSNESMVTQEQIAKWKRWGVLFIGVAIALFGEPLAGGLLMLGYEVGFRNGREILRSQS
jgi:hypothetical protein